MKRHRRDPSQAMRAADRDPAGGKSPVELTRHQPLDDSFAAGVSRTNRQLDYTGLRGSGPVLHRTWVYFERK